MKSVRRRGAIRVFVLGIGALVAAGCGTSGPQEPAEYATDAALLAVAYDDQVTAIQGAGEQALLESIEALRRRSDSGEISAERFGREAFETTRTQTITLFAAIGDTTSRYITDLDALHPPQGVAERHDAYIDALRSAAAGIGPLLIALSEATEFDELERIITASGFVDAQQRLGASCGLLQAALAEAAERAVDLRCAPS